MLNFIAFSRNIITIVFFTYIVAYVLPCDHLIPYIYIYKWFMTLDPPIFSHPNFSHISWIFSFSLSLTIFSISLTLIYLTGTYHFVSVFFSLMIPLSTWPAPVYLCSLDRPMVNICRIWFFLSFLFSDSITLIFWSLSLSIAPALRIFSLYHTYISAVRLYSSLQFKFSFFVERHL